MVIVESIFLDSDDFELESQVIPCNNMETADKIAEKILHKLYENGYKKHYTYEEFLETHDFYKKHTSNSHYYRLQGDDEGFMEITCQEINNVVTLDKVDNTEVRVGIMY